MGKVEIIEGEIFNDHRGAIKSMNTFDFDGVERYYFISNTNTEVKRGWHGHQFEKKWFQCLKGAFTLAFMEIDDWDNPDPDLQPTVVHLNEGKSEIVCVPEGYANCIIADEPDSLLLVFSGKRYPECLGDSWRYAPDYFNKFPPKE